MTDDESVAQRIADLQELEEARFLSIFISNEKKLGRNLGMNDTLSPRGLHKGLRYSSMTVVIINI
jgi:hypothetical protein